jgi:6,7-dimethyl-8-ribityllumazine synthase
MQRNIPKAKSQKLQAKSSTRVGLVVSSYNSDITFPMRDGAIETLKEAGVKEKNIFIFSAPGGFEIPIICQKVIKSKKLSGVIAIGCVIKGDTDHYHFIAQEATRGVMDVMLKTSIPITNAILTVNNLEQAKIRSTGEMNKGVEASLALLETLKI